jgi:hypothetical protein
VHYQLFLPFFETNVSPSTKKDLNTAASRSKGPVKPRLRRSGPTVRQAAKLRWLNHDWLLSSSMLKFLLFSGTEWTADARISLISLVGLKIRPWNPDATVIVSFQESATTTDCQWFWGPRCCQLRFNGWAKVLFSANFRSPQALGYLLPVQLEKLV